MDSLILNPRYRSIWAAACYGITGGGLVVDPILRQYIAWSPLAHSFSKLLMLTSIGLGIGILGLIWERFLLTCKRSWMQTFYSTSYKERIRGQLLRQNLIFNGWFGAMVIGLIVWCAVAEVFMIVPCCAASAVVCSGNLKLFGELKSELP